jgi:hypothetical protein
MAVKTVYGGEFLASFHLSQKKDIKKASIGLSRTD